MAKTSNNNSRRGSDNRKNRSRTGSGKADTRDMRKDEEVQNKRGKKYSAEDARGKTEAANDTSWYGGGSLLMQDAAKISFQTAAGVAIRPTIYYKSGLNITNLEPEAAYAWPGIMTLDIAFGPGYSEGWEAPMNVAARKMYTFVRHVNSGHANYDAANLMQYMLLMDSAFAFYAHMVRAYGLLTISLARNRYVPRDLCRSLNLSYDNLVQNMASFKYYINSYAARLNTMAVPDIPIFKRHMWLFSNIYADTPNDKAQFYAFRPAFFWRHIVKATGNYLEPWDVNDLPLTEGGKWTYQSFVDFGNAYLNELLNVEDWNIMSGDIMKAYGDRLFKVNPIADTYITVPTYEPEILMQIHNATVLGVKDTATLKKHESMRIFEVAAEDTNGNSGYLKFAPVLTSPTTAVGPANCAIDPVIDMPVENPDASLIAAATRFTVSGTIDGLDYTNKTVSVLPEVMGCDFILKAEIWIRNGGTFLSKDVYDGKTTNPGAVEVFEQRPLHYGATFDMGASDFLVSFGTPAGDITNVAVVPKSTLANIHEAAMLALFGVATM